MKPPESKWMLALAAAAAFALTLTFGISPASTAEAKTGMHGGGRDDGPKPTVVLVHGAFADSSGWASVGTALQDEGYPVLAFSNPLRGVDFDSQYLRDFLGTIEGPVVLVGHSYGGALITNAATGNPNVKSLVYIAAYALDAGETVQAANELGGGETDVVNHLILRPFPGAGEGNADAYIDPLFFPDLFAQDLPREEAEFMAASQRPAALAALGTPSGEPAWRTIPSWYMVASEDRIIPPEAERAMAERAGARTVEVESSHVPMLSQPHAVTKLIKKAAR